MRNFDRSLIVAMAVAGSVSCASAPKVDGLASDREITDYVTGHWPDFTMRAAYLAGRPWTANTLQSVKDVVCEPSEDIMKCRFKVSVRFQDGVQASPTLEALFGRQPDGSIEQYLEVIAART